MKKIVSAAIVLALLLAGAAGPASAGSRAIHRWQGAALALGAIGVIAALSSADAHATVTVRPSPGYGGSEWAGPGWGGRYDDDGWRGRNDYPAQVWVPGHWQTVRVWVPGGWQQVWNPGCSDRYGRYVPGRYIQRQALGRYENRRVWRDGYYR